MAPVSLSVVQMWPQAEQWQ